MADTFRALCAELVEALEEWARGQGTGVDAPLLTRARAALAQPEPDASQLSDGYHTFAELYEHRHALCLALMRSMPQHWWFSRRHADGELCFGGNDWFIVGAELSGVGSVTYHLPSNLYPVAQGTGAAELEKGRPWDGHTAADVVSRLRGWAAQPEPVGLSLAHEAYIAFVQICKGNSDDAGTYEADEELVRRALKRLSDLERRPAIKPVPEPEGVTYSEVLRIRDELDTAGLGTVDLVDFAHAVLQRWGRPTIKPVPVSERLPGPEDCDAEGRCWLFYTPISLGSIPDSMWGLRHRREILKACYTHWLPHHALPVPQP